MNLCVINVIIALLNSSITRRKNAQPNPKKSQEAGGNNHQRPQLELSKSFCRFHDRYKQYFATKTRSVVAQARQYLSGLMQDAARKNLERMTEVVPETEYQSLHHFTLHSPWERRPVMDQVALDADSLWGGSLDSALLLDESSLPKKWKEACRRSPPMVRPPRQGR
jgi:SRSO17 transposase